MNLFGYYVIGGPYISVLTGLSMGTLIQNRFVYFVYTFL